MSDSLTRKLLIMLIVGALTACSSDGVDIGPTIADLEELPPPIEQAELEPQASFAVDRQQVIDSFRALVEITADGSGTGHELRRLADLELESSLDNRIAEDETTQQRGREEALHAIGIYESYLETYPDRADNDMILYQLSRAYALESETEKSVAALDRIAAEYPTSQYMDEVQFRRGENLFVEREYEQAEAAYGTVVNNHQDSLFFKKALYKYGWTQFKQSRYEDALASYVRLLDVNREENYVREIDFNPELSRADLELLEDVVRVVSLAFSYQEEKDYISKYFAENGKRDYEPLLYLKLGELYLGKKRIIDGSDLFLAYTKEYPYSSHTPYFHQRAIETFQQAGYSDLVLEEKIAFVNRYDVNSEYWAAQEAATQQKLTKTLVLHLTELATHFHALARKSKKKRDYQVASGWYARFLKSFPDDPAAPRMNFLLAEILYDSGQYPQAIDEYQKTAYNYEPHKDSAEAGYAALLAFDALFKTTNASEIPALRRKRIKSAVRFTTTFPDDPRLSVVEMQTAQQFYKWKEYPDAIASAQRLIDNKNVKPETKKEAWTILSDSQFSTGDFAAAEASYLTLLGFMPKQSKERKPVREQIAASIYKQGEIAREQGNHLLAAQHFTRLGQVIPESPKRIVADYDAATAYIQLEDWPTAINRLETFRKRYPKNKQFSDGVTEKLALAYSKNGNQSLAAREILTLSKLPGTPERKRDLMWRAAELYEESGQTGRAIGVYKNYVKTYPYPLERSMELRHKIAEFYRAKNDTKNLHFWLNDIVRADAEAKSRRTDRSKYLAATASLELIAPLHRSYEKAKLTVPLKTSLRKKKKLMQQSIDAYSKAMKYQVAEVTTEATFQIAEIYHDFATSLMNSQRPKGLDEEQLEEYELLLEEQAFPFEEKAIDIHLTNFKRIPQGTYDEPTKKSLKVLGEMMPFRYARVESTDAYVDIQ
ncbi:MAG: tetratricopeptide repeat protein [Gammaproteobacteria bacterium]|nr:MAG: tetratricopeptide repeat protein [Gammaproteobacteria bacterium]UCH39062.1 MAG: tetratricopeptide repeat protein [Gammaproteobacteria bacterium]